MTVNVNLRLKNKRNVNYIKKLDRAHNKRVGHPIYELLLQYYVIYIMDLLIARFAMSIH